MILLLVVIYITFISLGLPDSLFGVAWPLAHVDFNVAESFGSIYSVIIALSTGGVSFFAGPLIKKFGTGLVTAISVVLTAIGLLIISFAPNVIVMIVGSIVAGLGAGAIDTGLNNFVSLNYKALHMNWLHCFWGVGVTISPLIMSVFLKDGSWQSGYRTISYIQFGISAIVILSLFLWRKYDKREPKQALKVETEQTQKEKINLLSAIKTKGVLISVLTLGLYCATEFLMGTWGASYIVNARNLTVDNASKMVSLYYGGIMFGRFISGIISLKINDKHLVRGGSTLLLVGAVLLAIPNATVLYIAMFFIGVGCGPIFPSILHSIPERFGKEKSTYLTGIHMSGAYAIGFVMQVCFGYVATSTTFNITPYVLIAFISLMFLCAETTILRTKKKTPEKAL